MELFNLHKFLFTLKYNNEVLGHSILFVTRDNEEKRIVLSDIKITSSPISCWLVDDTGQKHLTPFLRVKKVFLKEELVFDNSEVDNLNVRIIKGFK